MLDRWTRRTQRAGTFVPVEALESRTLFSASFATLVLDAPRMPEVATNATVYATNDEGERIRASRFLSNINFFDASSLSVAALPPVPGGASAGAGGFSLAPATPVPTPRFSKITFSLKLPKLSGH